MTIRIRMENVFAKVTEADPEERRALNDYLSFEDSRLFWAAKQTGRNIPTRLEMLKPNNTFVAGLAPQAASALRKDGFSVVFTEGREPPCPVDYNADLAWLRDYQKAAIYTALETTRGIWKHATGCLAGDTIIGVNRGGKSFNIPIEKLVARHNGGKPPCGPTWEPHIPTMIRARDEDGFVRLHRLKSAFCSGEKLTHTVRMSSGKKIQATMDHRFLAKDGWRRLYDLFVGDLICVEGVGTPHPYKKKPYYRCIHNMGRHPYASAVVDPRHRMTPRVPEHRAVVEASMSKLSLSEFVARVQAGDHRGLVFLDPKEWTVHHEDRNPTNNAISNLVVIRRGAHEKLHGQEGAWKHVTAGTVFEEIVEISKSGTVETYDLEMDSEPHNFIANGFVVHNSGKTDTAEGLMKSVPTAHWLFVVPKADLLRQTIERFEAHFGFKVGVIGSGTKQPDPNRRITVATFQTLTRALKAGEEWVETFLSDVEGLICDEVHTLSADSFLKVALATTRAYWRIGMSGTPLARGDRRSLFAVGAMGPVIHTVTPQELIARGILARPVIRMLRCDQDTDEWNYAAIYNALVASSRKRNGVVLDAIERCRKPAFCFVKLTKHGKALADYLKRMGIKAEFQWGQKSIAVRKAAIQRLLRGDVDVLICSVIFQDGIDVPELESVVVAHGEKSIIATLQRIGRAMRSNQGAKQTFEVWDILDNGFRLDGTGGYFYGNNGKPRPNSIHTHAHRRRNIYKSQGYEVTELKQIRQLDEEAHAPA